MRLVTPIQMNEIDSHAIHELGIPGIVLMENAAIKIVEQTALALGGSVVGRNILLLAGKGNNGGDAFAAARHLGLKGAKVCVFVLSEKNSISGDARINLDILEKLGFQVKELTRNGEIDGFQNELGVSELIIDGIFGTGLKGAPVGITAEIIDAVNQSGKYVISIDIPSGVNGETGKLPGICIKADMTVTFQLPKTGLMVHPGCDYTGELVVADIGIPEKAIERQDIIYFSMDKKDFAGTFPARTNDSNKGDYGKVLIVSGSTGMTGSGKLSVKAAMRAGSGLVYLGVPSSLCGSYSASLIEPIIIPLEDMGKGRLSVTCKDQLVTAMERMDVVAIGPGLSSNSDITGIVHEAILRSSIPIIIDADALNSIAGDIKILEKLKVDAILTPHPGEMARLTGLSIEEVQSDRIKTARDFALKWRVIVVLKGSRTVTATPDGKIYINTTGNPGMASAGTGDVLTGIIASLVGQGLPPANAAVAGVYLHGLAGDAAAAKKGMHGMIASDLIEEIPSVILSNISNQA